MGSARENTHRCVTSSSGGPFQLLGQPGKGSVMWRCLRLSASNYSTVTNRISQETCGKRSEQLVFVCRPDSKRGRDVAKSCPKRGPTTDAVCSAPNRNRTRAAGSERSVPPPTPPEPTPPACPTPPALPRVPAPTRPARHNPPPGERRLPERINGGAYFSARREGGAGRPYRRAGRRVGDAGIRERGGRTGGSGGAPRGWAGAAL